MSRDKLERPRVQGVLFSTWATLPGERVALIYSASDAARELARRRTEAKSK